MKVFNLIKGKPPKLGLALSGGATHGAAHIGILQILEREGIRPDFVAGTSAGALVGAAYCAGVPLKEMEKLFLNTSWSALVKIRLSRPLALFDTQPMENYLTQMIGDLEFKDLEIPFAAVCCDIVSGERIVIDQGRVAPAIRASAAIPGILSPVEIDGRLLVDGGMVDNLPIKQVHSMGAKFIIGCDVAVRGRKGKRPENPLETVLAMISIMQARSVSLNREWCDVYIKPDISQYPPWKFADSARMIEEGRKAAEASLPLLKRFRHPKM